MFKSLEQYIGVDNYHYDSMFKISSTISLFDRFAASNKRTMLMSWACWPEHEIRPKLIIRMADRYDVDVAGELTASQLKKYCEKTFTYYTVISDTTISKLANDIHRATNELARIKREYEYYLECLDSGSNEVNDYELFPEEARSPQIYLFEKPYHLRAQCSANRTGYGSIWLNGECFYEGTQYGETDSYLIVGVAP